MGNQCCNQSNPKAADDMDVTTSFSLYSKKTIEKRDPMSENAPINTVGVFPSHMSLFTKSSGELPIPKRFMKMPSKDDVTFVSGRKEMDSSILEDIKDISTVSPMITTSKTIRRQSKNQIILDPSRFRLEKRNPLKDDYEILNSLGKGAFAEVLMIKNKISSAKRALKVISKTLFKAASNYVEEIEILKQLVCF